MDTEANELNHKENAYQGSAACVRSDEYEKCDHESDPKEMGEMD